MHETAAAPAWVMLAYLISGICFILALRGLSSPESSRKGNRFGMIGMGIALVTTLVHYLPYGTPASADLNSYVGPDFGASERAGPVRSASTEGVRWNGLDRGSVRDRAVSAAVRLNFRESRPPMGYGMTGSTGRSRTPGRQNKHKARRRTSERRACGDLEVWAGRARLTCCNPFRDRRGEPLDPPWANRRRRPPSWRSGVRPASWSPSRPPAGT